MYQNINSNNAHIINPIIKIYAYSPKSFVFLLIVIYDFSCYAEKASAFSN